MTTKLGPATPTNTGVYAEQVWRRDSHGGQPLVSRESGLLVPGSLGLVTSTAPELAEIAKTQATKQFLALPSLGIDNNGWITGSGTKHEPLPSSYYGTGWHYGHPIDFLCHFTDGCGDPFQTLLSRHVSAHGYTGQDGVRTQFVSFRNLSWHAYDEAFYGPGWENAAAPGVACSFNVHMLSTLAQLVAVWILWVKKAYGFDVPIKRAPGLEFNAGIKCHTDGLDPSGNVDHWDPNGHWDSPWQANNDPINAWVSSGERAALNLSPWTSATFVAAVDHYAGLPTPGHPYPGHLLHHGSREHAILTVKAQLSKLKYKGFNAATDFFGDGLQKAVKAFQKDHPPLAGDGVIGPQTWNALFSAK